jgi:hypothetical protein
MDGENQWWVDWTEGVKVHIEINQVHEYECGWIGSLFDICCDHEITHEFVRHLHHKNIECADGSKAMAMRRRMLTFREVKSIAIHYMSEFTHCLNVFYGIFWDEAYHDLINTIHNNITSRPSHWKMNGDQNERSRATCEKYSFRRKIQMKMKMKIRFPFLIVICFQRTRKKKEWE